MQATTPTLTPRGLSEEWKKFGCKFEWPRGKTIADEELERSALLGQERRTFLVGWLLLSPRKFPSGPSWNGDDESEDEENSHDDKGKNPLEGNDLVGELGDTERGREHAEGEADGVVLVDEDEEKSVDKNGPNEDVAKDAGHQVIRVVDHESAIPVDGDKGPGQRAGNHRSVDETGIRVVAEVERREIEEVENENNLGPVEMRLDKEHDKGEMEEIVQDEVASDAGGGIDDVRVAREEVAYVTSLEDEEENPVDGGDGGIQGKGRAIQSIQVPEASANVVAIVRLVQGVVDGDDDRQDPSKECENLVGEDGPRRMILPLAEGVELAKVRHGEGSGWTPYKLTR